jgi:hypothetical protein
LFTTRGSRSIRRARGTTIEVLGELPTGQQK